MTVFNYTVNYVDLAIAAVILLAVISGFRRGMLITVLRFLRWTACVALCWLADSKLSPIVYESFVRPRALESIKEQIANSKNIDVVIENLNKTVAKLPKPIASMVDTSAIKISGDDIAASVLDSVFQPVLTAITRFCVVAAVFVIFFTVTTLIFCLIKRHQKRKDEEGKSLLRKTDRLLGGVLGFAKGAVVVLLVCSVLSFAAQTAQQSGYTNGFFDTLNSSSVYQLINNTNPFSNGGEK